MKQRAIYSRITKLLRYVYNYTMDTNNTIKNIPEKEDLKSIFLHNLSNKEISLVLKAINQIIPKGERSHFVFARTTETSLKMTVEEWIADTAEDHLYLLENPPTQSQKEEITEKKE